MEDSLSDKQWVDRALDSFASVEPRERGLAYVRAREDWARQLVSKLTTERVPQVIVAFFDVYETRRNDVFSELMWLIEALYAALPPKIAKDDACAILSATRHACGHGGIVEPINLANTAFEDSEYTPEFFEALRTYRNRLAGIHSNEVTKVKGEIALALWLDPSERLRPRNCLSAAIREGYFKLQANDRKSWSQLFRHADRTARRRPDKQWTTRAYSTLQNLGTEVFMADLGHWIKLPDDKVSLSTGGRHVVKSLIWFCALCDSNRLDHLVPKLIDLEYTKPKAAVHLIYAVGFWLESKPVEFADEHRKRLREKWPIAGSRIRG